MAVDILKGARSFKLKNSMEKPKGTTITAEMIKKEFQAIWERASSPEYIAEQDRRYKEDYNELYKEFLERINTPKPISLAGRFTVMFEKINKNGKA